MKKVVALLIAACISLASTPAFAAVDKGDRGQEVVKVQYILISHGYVGVSATGYFGTNTDKAVRHWQRVNGLAVDGVVGPATMASLDASVGGAKASQPAKRLTPPQPPAAATDVEGIIREVWPDDLEDWAVRIAFRESRFVPTAANACCYGIFQIHYRAHRGWLPQYGVNSPSDLFDPRTNAIVALALYEQTGPGPWNL